MSLSPQQLEDTRNELHENFVKAGVPVEQIAADLGTTTDYIEQLFRLDPRRLEDTWILRNYLLAKVESLGKEPTKFTALAGDYHAIWFLDPDYIDSGKIV